ncbi:DUF4082 domain-containing protein [Pseudarthrobacter quantipunctorum]|uniref:DUF4082 domain-containing protein n=1 Tax=Pseudarthrobacter quantipunctorum TaxID=3128980 RepID=A0ABZ2R696_9MICC
MRSRKRIFTRNGGRRWTASALGAALAGTLLIPFGSAAAADNTAGWDCAGGFVAVTFDDGPDISTRDRTSWILDTLRSYGVHATFFDLGERIADRYQVTRPDLVLREQAEGHTVANHTWDHPDLTKVSQTEVRSQLTRANDAIIAAGAARPTLFRPPFGYSNADVAAVGESLGLRQVLWDVNTGDTAATSPSAVSSAVLARVRSGSVVVLHDWAPHTAEALPAILDGLKERNLCPGLVAPSDTYNAQIRSYASVIPDPNGPRTATPRQCPCSIFAPTYVPAVPSTSSTGPYELGVRFATDVPGVITAVRFYKGSANTGLHPVRLWSNSGTLLGSANAGSETSSGWQQVDIPGGVRVQANTAYVASYSAPVGRFSQDVNYFTSTAGSAPLRGLASTASSLNGIYATATGAFPTRSYSASSYGVDVVFVPDTDLPDVPLAAKDDAASASYETTLSVAAPGVLANDGGTGLSVSAWTQPAHGTVSMQASGAYTYTPAAGFSGADSFTYTVRDEAGATASATVAVTVSAPEAVLARDSFARTLTGTWGTADLGGSWTPNSSTLSVDGQRGVFTLSPGQTRQVFLGVNAADTDTRATVQLNAAASGSGAYASIVTRRVASSVEYRGTARVLPNGTVSALIYRMNGSDPATIIGPEVTVPGLSAAPGSTLSLRLKSVGVSPTTLALTVWQAGTAQPAPQVTATDSTAALQTAGGTGLTAAISSKSTTGMKLSFDDFVLSAG